jgi:hypothetical protein
METGSTRGQDCRVLRAILSELTPKKDGFPSSILYRYQLQGFNDNYLRAITCDDFQRITGCDEEFAKAVELKILHKIRSESLASDDSYPLPSLAKAASAIDIADAVSFYRQNSEKYTQKDVINHFFFERNVDIQPSTLCRKLKSERLNFVEGRPQLLEDWICRDMITPALGQFRAIGRTKWKTVLRMLMKQLVRAQHGIGPVDGILDLVRNRSVGNSYVHASDLREDDSDTSSTSTSDAEDHYQADLLLHQQPEHMLQSSSENSFPVDDLMNHSEETLRLKEMRDRLREHTKLSLKKVERMEFPSRKTFRRYCKLYGWTQRKIELMAPHRQKGVSPSRIAENYAELQNQYELHGIIHPNQIIVCDELHWCKEWGDILSFIKGICVSGCKRAQGDGPARISDGVTVCPFGSIIGHLYLIQVIVKRSLKLNVNDIIAVMVKNGFAADSILVSQTDSGYQTADSFKQAIEALIVRLHRSEGSIITDNVASIRLRRKYLCIADGSSTHPFSDIAFSLAVAIAGLFFHQQEPDSTHVTNLYDRFNFLQTKLYSAKEIMMHLAIKFSPRVTNDRQATAWLEEVTAELAKTINLSSDICPFELNITDEAVLDKFETILKCKDSSFDTMHLLECIIPALAKGMQAHVTVASAKAVGLLPSGFKITSGYDFAENVGLWRGPFFEQVLKQPCVQGQVEREARMELFNSNKQAVVREHMADFGFDIFRAGLEDGMPYNACSSVVLHAHPLFADGPSLVNPNVLEGTLTTCFSSVSETNKDQILLFLNIYEQQRKLEAKRIKDARSRGAIQGVNSRTQDQLQEMNESAGEAEAADSAKKFEAAIEHCLKKAEEANKQLKLLDERSKKCGELLTKYEEALQGNSDRSVIVKACKRTVTWGLNNAEQGQLHWDVACEDGRKIRRLVPNSDDGRTKLSEWEVSFDNIFQRIREIDTDRLQEPVADLAFAIRDNEDADEWTADWADRLT